MKTAVILFPGTNREGDILRALTRSLGEMPTIVWHGETTLPDVDLVVLPGGFSYGDYLRSGAMAARSPILEAVCDHAERGGYVLGVCNGFQILTEAQLLPGVLLPNNTQNFICKKVRLRVEAKSCFTNRYAIGQTLEVPVAHHDGNYFIDEAGLSQLKDQDRVAFRYVDEMGKPTSAANINGSIDNIAGVLSANKRVLGMMPHPENAIEPQIGGTDGRGLFEALAQLAA